METLQESRFFDWCSVESWAPLLTSIAARRVGHRIVAAALHGHYDGMIAYHGCRPPDVSSYYRDGLRASANGELDTRAHAIFSCIPGVSAKLIDAAIAGLGRRDEGRIFVCVDKRHLIAHANHYLIYGSERLQCIAAALGESAHTCLQALKRYGRPTVIRVALPWEFVTQSDSLYLARAVATDLASVRRGCAVSESWSGFEFGKPLPGQFVLAHEHPEALNDLHDGMRPYHYLRDAHLTRDSL